MSVPGLNLVFGLKLKSFFNHSFYYSIFFSYLDFNSAANAMDVIRIKILALQCNLLNIALNFTEMSLQIFTLRFPLHSHHEKENTEGAHNCSF